LPRTEFSKEELHGLIIEEVEEARDIHQLATQLAPLLPIKSFDDLLKAADSGRMVFRDTPFEVESLREHIPAVVFPVEDLRGLVERLGHLVRMAPSHLGVDMSSADGMRRQMRHGSLLAPGLGMVRSGGLTAIAVDRRAELQPIPGVPAPPQ
jgi:hypothetical protein